MPKKNFTKATTNVANKFFSGLTEPESDYENYTQVVMENPVIENSDTQMNDSKQTKNNKITNNYKHTNVTNKSKHYDERGKRAERYGLLLDKQLKDDLKHLSNATGSKSVNDFIVTILLEYVDRPDNQSKLQRYMDILKE